MKPEEIENRWKETIENIVSCPSTFTTKKFSHHSLGDLQPLLTKRPKVIFTPGVMWGFSGAELRGLAAVFLWFARAFD